MTDRDKQTPQGNFVPAGPARAEVRASNSRFIASVAPSATVEAARAVIAGVRAENAQAADQSCHLGPLFAATQPDPPAPLRAA